MLLPSSLDITSSMQLYAVRNKEDLENHLSSTVFKIESPGLAIFSLPPTVENQVTHLTSCELLQLLEDSLSSSKSQRAYWEDTGKCMRDTWRYCPALNANDHSLLFADTTDLPIKPATVSSLPRHPQHEGTPPKLKYEESEHILFECDMQTITLTYFQCYGC